MWIDIERDTCIMATQAVDVEVAATSKRPSLRERLDLGSGFTPYLLVLPTIIVILVVAGYPIVNSFLQSLQDNPLSASPSFVGLQNYVQVLESSEFHTAVAVTFGFTIIAVFLETVFGLGIALLINATFPGRGLVRAAILVPWAFPTVISAQIWYLMYNDRTGIVSYILQQIHLLPQAVHCCRRIMELYSLPSSPMSGRRRLLWRSCSWQDFRSSHLNCMRRPEWMAARNGSNSGALPCQC